MVTFEDALAKAAVPEEFAPTGRSLNRALSVCLGPSTTWTVKDGVVTEMQIYLHKDKNYNINGGRTPMMQFNELLRFMIEKATLELHLVPGSPVMYRDKLFQLNPVDAASAVSR